MNFVHFVLQRMMQLPVEAHKTRWKLKIQILITIIHQINPSTSELINEPEFKYFELD